MSADYMLAFEIKNNIELKKIFDLFDKYGCKPLKYYSMKGNEQEELRISYDDFKKINAYKDAPLNDVELSNLLAGREVEVHFLFDKRPKVEVIEYLESKGAIVNYFEGGIIV